MMGHELDLDDVVAGNPLAERELAEIRAAVEQSGGQCTVTKVCHWEVNDWKTSIWRGACGVVRYFPDGATPKDSDLRHCPRCGGIVLVDGCPVAKPEKEDA